VTQTTSDAKWVSGGSHHAIVTVGDPILRQRALEVQDLSSVRPICEQMVSLLRELNGAGLAAPQIGHSIRIAVIEVRKTDLFPDRPESQLYVMVNPVIERLYGPEDEAWEGCYSVPGLMGLVTRPRFVDIRYNTPEGEERYETLEGYVSRVVQHECDHLDGIIFMSRMTSMNTLTTVQNYMAIYHKSTKPVT
jgi:peptide deformylase